MSTQIEWTHWPGTIGETWNPITGCNKVDRGCKNCYALTMHKRLQAMGQPKYAADFLAGAKVHEDTLALPYGWKKPRTVFVNSMSDLFHQAVPFEFVRKVFKVMRDTPQHQYLILTKRTDRLLEYQDWEDDLPFDAVHNFCPSNVALGTSGNDQGSIDKRVPQLLRVRNCLRFLSYEPATGPANLRRVLVKSYVMGENKSDGQHEYLVDPLAGRAWEEKPFWSGNVQHDHPRLHWVIMGGESGHKAEPMHPDWARRVRDDCAQTGVPFFFKQYGNWVPHTFIKDGLPYYDPNTGPSQYLFTEPYRPQNMIRSRKKNWHDLDGKFWHQFPVASIPLPQTT